MCKISILVPIYNTEKYLSQCLRSIVNQTFKDIEIICINDGSTDRSIEIVNNFACEDNRVRMITKSNTGYGNTMNIGLATAKGEYIGIVESDDFIDPQMYESLYDNSNDGELDIVKSNYWLYRDGHDTPAKTMEEGPYGAVFTPREDNKSIFLRGQSIWSAIYKKDFLSRNNINFNETPGASFQDVSFAFITMACADSVKLIEEAFLHYRQDNPNSSINSKKKMFCICDEFKKIWEFIEERKEIGEKLKYIVPELQWGTYYWNYGRIEYPNNFIFLEKMLDEFVMFKNTGKLKRDAWLNKEVFDQVENMLSDKETALYQNYVKYQMMNSYREAFFNELRSHQSIYLYGAGIICRRIIGRLAHENLNIEGILVSSLENNPKEVMGYKVVDFNTILEKDRDIIPVVLTVKEDGQLPIIQQLIKSGFRKVYATPTELQQIL